MMNYITKQMLRMFGEDTGSPELRTPELGKLQSGSRKRASHRSHRIAECPAAYAWLSYEQLKRI